MSAYSLEMKIEKLTSQVDNLTKAAAAQNHAIAEIRRQWSMWSDQWERMHRPDGVNPAALLTQLVST